MTAAYTIFAECPTIGADPAYVDHFMDQLWLVVREHRRAIMADRHIVACPNFRRALRSSQHGPVIRQWFKDKKIHAAMIDGRLMPDGRIDHITFNEFHDWFNKFNLWPSTMPETYKATSPVTQYEMDFFDIDAKKIFTASRNRDPDFVKNLRADLDNPVLTARFGAHHAAFKNIVQAVYDDGSTEGTIRVKPYPRDDGRNIHQRFDQYLREREIDDATIKAMLELVCDFSDATMASVASKIAGGTPVFSPMQVWVREIIYQSQAEQAIPQVPRNQNTRKLKTYDGPTG